ncbi:Mg2+ and Co2+ transporter [Vibrio sp. SCSIO 43135]|uniref:Mg2+ and Co2+ transporter n=1 Tax=Vibrio sp. SCSIO 43135 TaxID=2819096 RepID=UPI002074DB6A|nr:Mg2+ and Co2+ transporter [Vibrio sp. SCSIO 43135]USD43398.1 Mg2+ and Co2+ transporter [Vibrio sp. SCSIO 43135]
MIIHNTSLTYDSLPTVYALLDTPVFMWAIVIFTAALLCWVLKKLWYIHSLPKIKAKELGLGQAKLVFWLCILGLAWKPLWVLAVLAIVTDWDKVQGWIKEARS